MSRPGSHTSLDVTQFEQLFKEHFQHLCNFAFQFVQDQDAAQDICQKVFISIWEKREELNPEQSIKSYLFTSVRNRSLNYLRDQKKYRSQVLDIDCADFDLVEEEEDQLAIEELKAKIDAALSTLPEKCRMVFQMSRYQNMKYREIAEELDISQKTVEAHMSKAMKRLREQLEDYLLIILIILGWLN